MLKIGITGGIGSGKSIVCTVFKQLKIPVFNADFEAKALLNTEEVIAFYRNEFGLGIFSGNSIDKTKLANLIFNNNEALQKVNKFIHPLVYKRFDEWCLKYTDKPYVLNEAALLFESQGYKKFDFTILVVAPIETRIKRVIERDGASIESIKARIEKQFSDEEKIKLASFVINNNDNELILPSILKLHNDFLNLK
jgi:dephospho-CoA kinase